jgi:uncharacterized Rmd1/YagE family protein
MAEPLFRGAKTLVARAFFLGQRVDVRALEKTQHLATAPLALRAGDGCAVVFRYGAVVLFGLDSVSEAGFLDSIQRFIAQPLEDPEDEAVEIAIDADRPERVEVDETITLHEASIERLQTVADILGKSVALAHFETQMAEVFERIEPLAARLRSTGRTGSQGKDLLREIGDVLLMQHQMVGRVEVIEKPELVWERPDLDRLYTRLQDEYELPDRHRALDRKLELIARTAQTVLDLLQTRRSLRVEWYIVILILVEMVILLYDLLIRSS